MKDGRKQWQAIAEGYQRLRRAEEFLIVYVNVLGYLKFTALGACERLMPRSHCSVFVQKRIKISVFVKPFTLLRTKTHKNGGFRKRSSKWIFTKTEVFENAMDQCERTKTDKNKTAATATTKYFAHFSPKSTLKCHYHLFFYWLIIRNSVR